MATDEPIDVVPNDAAPEPAQRSPGTSCLVIACLVIAGLFYLLSTLLVFDLGRGGGDYHSRAIGQGLAILAQIILWIPLGIYVFVCIGAAELPGRIKALGVGLVLLGAAGSVTAVGMMSGPSLLAVPPVILPVLAGLFGIWARTQATAPAAALRRAAIGFAIVALPLGVGPFVAWGIWVAGEPERQAEWARMQAEQEREAQAQAAAEAARFRALNAQSRLDDVLPFVASPQRDQALALIPTLESGPADAARLLDRGTQLYEFSELHLFGLEATPDLCRAFRARIAARLRQTVSAQTGWQSILFDLQTQLPNARWFMTEGCDLSPELRDWTAALQRASTDYAIDDYARELAEIQQLLRPTPPGANP